MAKNTTSILNASDDVMRAILYAGAAYAGWQLYQKLKDAAQTVSEIDVGVPEIVGESYQGWQSLLDEEEWERKLAAGQCNVVNGTRSCRNFDGTLTRTTDIKPWWEQQ